MGFGVPAKKCILLVKLAEFAHRSVNLLRVLEVKLWRTDNIVNFRKLEVLLCSCLYVMYVMLVTSCRA